MNFQLRLHEIDEVTADDHVHVEWLRQLREIDQLQVRPRVLRAVPVGQEQARNRIGQDLEWDQACKVFQVIGHQECGRASLEFKNFVVCEALYEERDDFILNVEKLRNSFIEGTSACTSINQDIDVDSLLRVRWIREVKRDDWASDRG
jgi:hypothetical protein